MDKIEPVKLSPCPFCGSEAVTDMRANGWVALCRDRFATCPINARTHHQNTQAEAIAAWNKRPAQHDAGEGADLMERAASIMRNCHIETGVCCCGDPMGERHASPMNCGHSPCDSGAYQASLWLDDFSAMKGPNNE